MATTNLTMTVEESTKARLIQAAKKDDRTMSNMANKLMELGLKQFWDGFEPVIPDPAAYLAAQKKEEEK